MNNKSLLILGTLLIVQSADVAFVPGERVRVIRGGGDEARVLKP